MSQLTAIVIVVVVIVIVVLIDLVLLLRCQEHFLGVPEKDEGSEDE